MSWLWCVINITAQAMTATAGKYAKTFNIRLTSRYMGLR
jgi:hypothetical protein